MGNSNQNPVPENKGSSVELKRTMTLPLLVMFGLAYLAPTVVFNYYGIITVNTGGMMTLAYLITTLVMFFSAWSYAQMAREFPQAGSAYTYVQKSIGPRIGFMSGWVMLLDYVLLPMECFLLIGVYVNAYFPAIPIWATVIVLIVVAAIINIIGVKLAAMVDTVIVAAGIIFCILMVIVVIKYVTGGGGSGSLLYGRALYNADTFNFGNITSSAALLCVAFLGFDAVTTMSEEVKEPTKIIPKAILLIAVGAGIAFSIISYFCTIAWPEGYLNIVDPDSGIFELFTNMNMEFMGTIFFIVDNLASFVCAMTGITAVSRIMYTMGRDNILPKKAFGRINEKFQTPVINILIVSAVAFTALFYQDNLMGAVSLVSFGAVSGFVLVNLSVFVYFVVKQKKRDPKSIVRYAILPLIGLVVTVILWINLETNAKILGIIWLAVGVIYLGIKTKGFRELPAEMNFDGE